MTAEYTAGWNAALEAAARACVAQQAIFGSEQYAVNQPLSSFGERFACGRCAEAILALAQDAPNTSSTRLAAEGADPVPEKVDLDCFKAIFGFTDEQVDVQGDDKRVLELLARHRLSAITDPTLAREEGYRQGIEAMTKVRDGYKSQMKFCDIEAMGYFREFVRRLDDAIRALASKEQGHATE